MLTLRVISPKTMSSHRVRIPVRRLWLQQSAARGLTFHSYPCCGCHGLSCPVPPPPRCPDRPSSPLAHEVAVVGFGGVGVAGCFICSVHPPAPVCASVGEHSPSVLNIGCSARLLSVLFFSGATACACFCVVYFRPCAYGRCGQSPPVSGVVFDLCFCWAFGPNSVVVSFVRGGRVREAWPSRQRS